MWRCSAEFNDEENGKTLAHITASKETYGANKLWCILKGIPIHLDSDSRDESEPLEPSDDGEDLRD